jgi:protein-tyrosine phosphatase
LFNRVLVVCLGNICRSPMAAAMLQAALKDKTIASAGIGALVGEPADPMAISLMNERGLDLSAHRARQIDEQMLHAHDLLLVMEGYHREWIEDRWPQARGRVYRWGHWSDFDVPDPYRRDEQAFREALALLDRGLEDWKEKI